MKYAILVFVMISAPAYIIMKHFYNQGVSFLILSVIYVSTLAVGLSIYTWWMRMRRNL